MEMYSDEFFDSLRFDELLELPEVNNSFSDYCLHSITPVVHKATTDNNCVVKRKRKTEKIHMFKPRVLKCDVRRSYSTMFANVINGFDLPVLYGFMDTYCAPNFHQQVLQCNSHIDQPYDLKMQGVIAASKFWAISMHTSPDYTFTVQEATIHYSPDSWKSKIICRYAYNATKLYNLEVMDLADDEITNSLLADSDSAPFTTKTMTSAHIENEEMCTPLNSGVVPVFQTKPSGKKRKLMNDVDLPVTAVPSDDSIENKLQVISRIQASVDSMTCRLPLSTEYGQMHEEFQLTMYVDENFLITGVVMEKGELSSSK